MKKTILLSFFILMVSSASFAQIAPCLAIGFSTNDAIITALKDGKGARSASIESSKSTATKVVVRIQSFKELPDLCVQVSACSGELKVEQSGSCE